MQRSPVLTPVAVGGRGHDVLFSVLVEGSGVAAHRLGVNPRGKEEDAPQGRSGCERRRGNGGEDFWVQSV